MGRMFTYFPITNISIHSRKRTKKQLIRMQMQPITAPFKKDGIHPNKAFIDWRINVYTPIFTYI